MILLDKKCSYSETASNVIEFEKSKHNHIVIPYEQYEEFKEVILNGRKYTEGFNLNCNANPNFVRMINNITDETIISQAIDQLKQFYKLKDISTELGFKSSLFIAYNSVFKDVYLKGRT